jgi:microcystin-dependent protein
MATYTANIATTQTLSANTVDTVTLTSPATRVTVTCSSAVGAGTIYFTVGSGSATTPTVGGSNAYAVVAGSSFTVDFDGSFPTVKLISSAALTYTIAAASVFNKLADNTVDNATLQLSAGIVSVKDGGITSPKLDATFAASLGVPVGLVLPYGGSSSPTGWLLCYGQAVSRTTYSALYAVTGTQFGSGDGINTFNLPDLRGRTIAGLDNMGGSAANRITSATSGITGTTLGAAGGDQRVHQHTHVQDAHGHGVSDPTHRHSIITKDNAGGFGTEPVAKALYGSTGSTVVEYAATGISIVGATATNQNFGSGASQNVQPTIILNYIIKA